MLGKVLVHTGSQSSWPASLGIQQSGYWAQFDRNQTRNLLRKTLKPYQEICENDIVKTVRMAMETFDKVREFCFGLYLDENYLSHIRDFGYWYSCLVNSHKDVDFITFNVTLKAHILFCHVPQF